MGKGGKTSFFDIRVKGDTGLLENQIREIAPKDNITVDYANDTIILSGTAENEQTIAKAVQLAQAYAAKAGKRRFPRWQQRGVQIYMPSYDGDTGELTDQKGTEQKVKVLNHIRIDNPHQILLEVKVAQVDRTALK